MRSAGIAAALCVAATAATTTTVAAEVPEMTFNVVGTWSTGAMFKEHEEPMFETLLPEMTGGKLNGEVTAMTELGLKGFETVKLLQSNVYDAGFMALAYIASGDPVFEGIDLALAPANTDEARALVTAYEPVVSRAMEDIHGVKYLISYPFPAQVLVCTEPFETLADLQGRKIRVYSTTLGDLAEGLGGVSVSIPLSEVPTALQRGVIDCGISSGVSMYAAKWQDVVGYLYETPVSAGIAAVGMNMAKWDALGEAGQAAMMETATAFAEKAWAALKETEQQGIACLTGTVIDGGQPCRYGEPADMTLVRDSAVNTEIREAVLRDFVLKRYAERCGPDCTALWNETAGTVIGIEAQP
ncbi:TRAP transporter substrate-binding protein [Algihabitans albus]|uniref:TRAP transporter substrate-binding protein n=1 Tax=Algihabitans albus TaxID=2164067 RepID=UPI0013C2A6F7|nr:TRAP transporter substrate-binding protein [Algihabitans albus]